MWPEVGTKKSGVVQRNQWQQMLANLLLVNVCKLAHALMKGLTEMRGKFLL
jgi:hypothetical protein